MLRAAVVVAAGGSTSACWCCQRCGRCRAAANGVANIACVTLHGYANLRLLKTCRACDIKAFWPHLVLGLQLALALVLRLGGSSTSIERAR